MKSTSAESKPAIGFYTVEYSEALGWTGGYLILNAGGRPLEFHCTLPVRPTRSHEILYGASLTTYLIGDAIGKALFERARVRPQLICADQVEAVGLGDTLDVPLALLPRKAARDGGDGSSAGNAANDSAVVWRNRQATQQHAASWVELRGNGQTYYCSPTRHQQATEALPLFADLSDWQEPFGRIREAIREAQQGAATRAA
ncbi:hypothetical protein SH139x_004122 [Planctomycetaceae bacterium SH139]